MCGPSLLGPHISSFFLKLFLAAAGAQRVLTINRLKPGSFRICARAGNGPRVTGRIRVVGFTDLQPLFLFSERRVVNGRETSQFHHAPFAARAGIRTGSVPVPRSRTRPVTNQEFLRRFRFLF